MNTTEEHANSYVLIGVEYDHSVKQYIDDLLFDNPESSLLNIVSHCINKFGNTYSTMKLKDWQTIVVHYLESRESPMFDENISDAQDLRTLFVEATSQAQYSSIEENQHPLPIFKNLDDCSFSNKETVELFKRYRNGDKKAYELLVKSNIKLVTSIARAWNDSGVELDDIIQEGSIGLINAINHFNYHYNVDFQEYAKKVVFGHLLKTLPNIIQIVRLPANVTNLYMKISGMAEAFEQQNGYPPSANDIEIDETDNIKLMNFVLQMPGNLKDVKCVVENFDNHHQCETNQIDEFYEVEYNRFRILRMLNYIDERKRLIITKYYGLDGNPDGESLNTIGDSLGLTRERVRQIVEKTIRELRDFSKIKWTVADVGDIIRLDSSGQVGRVVGIRQDGLIPPKIVLNMYSGETKEIPAYSCSYEVLPVIIRKKPLIEQLSPVIYAKEKKRKIEENKTNDKYSKATNTFHRILDEQHEVDVCDDIKVGDSIVYGDKRCTICKIFISGKTSKFLVKYDNEVLDYVPNRKDLYRKVLPQSGSLNTETKVGVAKLQNVKEAMVGDRIVYNHKRCTVVKKKTMRGALRLVVRYENGTIDSLPNDWNRYKIINSREEANNTKNNHSKTEQYEASKYQLPTPLSKLANINIKKGKQLRQCRKRELIYIGDVKHDYRKELSEPGETETVINPKILERIFDKKTTSYKYFWFLSLISLAKESGYLMISYKDIVIRMAALAWPIVMNDEIDLGSRDMMSKYLSEVKKKTKLIKAASSSVIEAYLSVNYDSEGIGKILEPLLKNVPYRFLSPWIKYTTNEEVVEKSNSTDCACLYALQDDCIVLNEKWWDYIKENYTKICNSAERSFVTYLKLNNNHSKLVKFMSKGWSIQ